ncbi:MAG: META domain-containing protein [Ignavibacteriae bacterium]|nr:META domain-containing protein [Ignavibacteriota bacterium]
MKRILFLLAISITIGISVQSCREMGIDPWDKGKGNGGENPIDTNGITLPIEKLVSTKWQLISIVRTQMNGTIETQHIQPKDQFITLAFDSPARVSGANICNAYGAAITSTSNGKIKFTDIFSTDAECGTDLPDREYMVALKGATTYSATEMELKINYEPEVSVPEIISRTLVFAPLTDNTGGGEIDIRVKQLAGQVYTLYSFVKADVEDVLTDSKDCEIIFYPDSKGKGTASILADCNKGEANISFNTDYDAISLDNITLTKIACQNQLTADRFVDFLRNTGHFEYSDYGTTLTIWSSLPTIGEYKIVLKVAPIVVEPTIEIQDIPSTGTPVGSYPSFTLLDAKYDGKYIHIAYQYNGHTDDYQISAYSLFEFDKSMPPMVVVDLVTDGSMNSISSLTAGTAMLSLDGIRKRIVTANPGITKMFIVLHWNGQDLGSIGEVEVQL